MGRTGEWLSREDYEEPCCPLNLHPEGEHIPTGRMIDKLDEYLSRNDCAGAERHLRYWLAEAEGTKDRRGKLTVLNEQIGLYRKLGREGESLGAAADALALVSELGLEGTVTCGTTLINAATAYKAFGRAQEALPLYRRARAVYESALKPEDGRLGGLYNNMALTLTELGEYREAEDLFRRALSVMEGQEYGQPEMAVTLLNLADLAEAELGGEAAEERVGEYLARAEALLNTPGLPMDGNYAFVCEKCAPVFGYYGWFMTEKELTGRAREIYERA